MTVKELKEKLSEFNPDAVVCRDDYDFGYQELDYVHYPLEIGLGGFSYDSKNSTWVRCKRKNIVVLDLE